MVIRIFDVSHGFCALIIADNGNLILVDCGHNEPTGFRPSTYLQGINCTGIEKLIIQNYDQDHISDLPNVYGRFSILGLVRNQSVSATQLENLKLKAGPITDAMDCMIGMTEEFIHPIVRQPEFPQMSVWCYYHDFPLFTDTNNLSVVTFLEIDGFTIVFTGDLEEPGWLEHLKEQRFCVDLTSVNIFVASHHGRSSGYCEEVFDHCSPDLVVVSDKEIVHDTQKQLYAKHSNGVLWNGGPEKRYVLTTRADGDIEIEKRIGMPYHVTV